MPKLRSLALAGLAALALAACSDSSNPVQPPGGGVMGKDSVLVQPMTTDTTPPSRGGGGVIGSGS